MRLKWINFSLKFTLAFYPLPIHNECIANSVNCLLSELRSSAKVLPNGRSTFVANMVPLHKFLFVIFALLISECAPRSIEDDESFLQTPKYTKYENLVTIFNKLEASYPELAKVYSIGKSVEGRELLVIQISEGVKQEHPERPSFKYVANMHGDESIGRELMVYLAQYLLLNYGKDDRVTKLVNTTDIHLMPSLNPDGFEASKVSIVYYIC